MCIKWHEFTTKKYTINSILSENIKLAEIDQKTPIFFYSTWFMVFNATFNNISVISVSFIGGENQSTQRKHPTCCKSLTNFIT
jgi:hypothetical protein